MDLFVLYFVFDDGWFVVVFLEWVNNMFCFDIGCVFGGTLIVLCYLECEIVLFLVDLFGLGDGVFHVFGGWGEDEFGVVCV